MWSDTVEKNGGSDCERNHDLETRDGQPWQPPGDLGARRRLWLFSDTWVGQVRDGKRYDATVVNNSVGLQEDSGETSKIRFAVRKNAGKKPAAIFRPSDERGWFWLQAGMCVDKNLYVFLSQVEKTGQTGVFGFRQIGQSLGIVSNPDDDDFLTSIHFGHSGSRIIRARYARAYG
jgi:hypothetical protein